MKLPPYGKVVDPDAREIWVYFGADAWSSAKYRAARKLPVLLLPPDQNPDAFRWPVAGKQMLLVQQGDYDLFKIPPFANLLFGYGASVVRAVYGDGQFVCYAGDAHEQAA